MSLQTFARGPLREVEVRASLAEPRLSVMNFLNNVVAEYPDAVSFAPGRPLESLFAIEGHAAAIDTFVGELASRTRRSREAALRELGQYSRTEGVIREVISAHLAIDEGIHVDPTAIIVTVGAQEAMALILAGMFEPGKDVLLAADPSYIGMTALAELFGVTVVPIPCDHNGPDLDLLEEILSKELVSGRRVRAFYDIPDFNNPLGRSTPIENRLRLLTLCAHHRLVVIEDNAYGMYAYDCQRCPTLKRLDENGTVMYIGSFSKTLFPGLRVGFLVADQRVAGAPSSLAAALSRVKSLLTVNTSPLAQAIAGGMLLQAGGSLEPIVAPKREQYRRQRDALIEALAAHFSDGAISWSKPAGGFFVAVTLPFEFGLAELEECAATYGVIVSPMQFFCVAPSRANQVRLSFSYVKEDEIVEGVRRFAAFAKSRSAKATQRLCQD